MIERLIDVFNQTQKTVIFKLQREHLLVTHKAVILLKVNCKLAISKVQR